MGFERVEAVAGDAKECGLDVGGCGCFGSERSQKGGRLEVNPNERMGGQVSPGEFALVRTDERLVAAAKCGGEGEREEEW